MLEYPHASSSVLTSFVQLLIFLFPLDSRPEGDAADLYGNREERGVFDISCGNATILTPVILLAMRSHF